MITYNHNVPFDRLTASQMVEGDVFYTGYGHGTFRYTVDRPCDTVIHFRSETGKRRRMRASHTRQFFIHRRATNDEQGA